MNHPGGMKRRLENAGTVLLLDEPTIGLGPANPALHLGLPVEADSAKASMEPRCMVIFLP